VTAPNRIPSNQVAHQAKTDLDRRDRPRDGLETLLRPMDQAATHRPQRPRSDDDDFPLVVAPPRPLIAPGVYEAKSTAVYKNTMYNRLVLRITFRIFDGEATDGVILADGIDGFFPMGDNKKRPGPASKIARLTQLLNPNARMDSFKGSDLKDKLWRVRVETVEKDRKGEALHAANRYSKVADVLERL
jgi:hypothetical protein